MNVNKLAARLADLASLRRFRRRAFACVYDEGLEVDCLETTSASRLGQALGPLQTRLRSGAFTLRFVGVQEDCLPFGIARSERLTNLDNLCAASSFLNGESPANHGCGADSADCMSPERWALFGPRRIR